MKEIMLKRLKPLIIQLIIFGITYSISFVLRDRYFLVGSYTITSPIYGL